MNTLTWTVARCFLSRLPSQSRETPFASVQDQSIVVSSTTSTEDSGLRTHFAATEGPVANSISAFSRSQDPWRTRPLADVAAVAAMFAFPIRTLIEPGQSDPECPGGQ